MAETTTRTAVTVHAGRRTRLLRVAALGLFTLLVVCRAAHVQLPNNPYLSPKLKR